MNDCIAPVLDPGVPQPPRHELLILPVLAGGVTPTGAGMTEVERFRAAPMSMTGRYGHIACLVINHGADDNAEGPTPLILFLLVCCRCRAFSCVPPNQALIPSCRRLHRDFSGATSFETVGDANLGYLNTYSILAFAR